MQFTLGLVSVLSTVFFLSPAAAVDIYFSRDASCAGNYHHIVYNAHGNYCWGYADNTGSVSFQNLPSGAKAQVYNDQGCSQYAGETTFSACLYGTGVVHSANWFYPYKKLARKDSEPSEPTRFGLTYELPDSTTREIELPNNDFDSVWKLVDAKDFDALAKFPTFVHAEEHA